MQTLSRFGSLTNNTHYFHFPRFLPISHTQNQLFKKTSESFALRTSAPSVSEVAEDDVLQMFLKERELNGDFISKVSDLFWQRGVANAKYVDADTVYVADTPQQAEQVVETGNDDGFLKLSKTREWLLGDNSAPINKKPSAKALRDDRERRKKLNLLEYEAAAFSYAVGVFFSCLYLQLLYQHADSLSKEMVPQIFLQKKSKKIGIRSEDLQNFVERSIKGTGVALSSPRLVIPAAIYGLWVLSHRYFVNDFFDFQLVPAMVGMFVYKAAALVQVYRDNEDLQFVFPENDGTSD
ncbi:uncharacterized protein LOC123209800 isoform X2 [Mangifera indica]|uniref:uncharacterized protein LOC123209800 isoform X2 n=1 Tax=Mangifera indica TaxID=29780 RepID=UPI001CFB3F47|nr:uncharacterized protein LOC123209800 isoform X2 [Mangifera indica]